MATTNYADLAANLPLIDMSSSTTAATPKTAFDPTVAKNQFLQLFATQLQHQDPLDPAKQEDFLSQLAQFSSVETQQSMDSHLTSLGTKLDSLVTATQNNGVGAGATATLQALSAGAGLLGKNVRFGDGVSRAGIGVVDQVKPDNGSILVRIGGMYVPIADIQSIEPNSAAG